MTELTCTTITEAAALVAEIVKREAFLASNTVRDLSIKSFSQLAGLDIGVVGARAWEVQ